MGRAFGKRGGTMLMVGIPKSVLLRAVQVVNQQTLNMLFSSAHKSTKLFNDRGYHTQKIPTYVK